MSSEANKHKQYLNEVLKMSIKLQDKVKDLPSGYILNLPDFKEETDPQQDIENVQSLSNADYPDYIINSDMIRYPKQILIDENGNIVKDKIKQRKRVSWSGYESKKKGGNKEPLPEPEEEDFGEVEKLSPGEKRRLEIPGVTKTYLKEEKISILKNIIDVMRSSAEEDRSQIDDDITPSIVSEWIRQLFISKYLCCYEEDMNRLLNGRTKIDIVKEKYPNRNIFVLNIITKPELLPVNAKMKDGAFVDFQDGKIEERKFEEAIKTAHTRIDIENDKIKDYENGITKTKPDNPTLFEVRELYIYIFLKYNNSTYNLLISKRVNDDITFQNYTPFGTEDKDNIDELMLDFLTDYNCNYEKDQNLELKTEQREILPNIGREIWQEDFCIFFLEKFLEGFFIFEEIDSYLILRNELQDMYEGLIYPALKLK